MPNGDVNIPAPDGQEDKIFGLPRTMVIIGAVGLGAIVLLQMTKKQDTSNMVPISTAVQLGDVQQRQLEIFSRLGVMGQQIGAGFEGVGAQFDTLTKLIQTQQTDLLAQMKTNQEALNQSILSGDADLKRQLEAQQTGLLAQLAALGDQQKAFYKDLLGQIDKHDEKGQLRYSQLLEQMKNDQTALLDAIGRLNAGANNSDWYRWYEGWRANFGSTVEGNQYDLNHDNLVDIRDYGIGRQYYNTATGVT